MGILMLIIDYVYLKIDYAVQKWKIFNFVDTNRLQILIVYYEVL